ncbi:hypothetical protein SAMN05443572_112269 [Myxococcus fulvus]|uniref:DUF5666 domain-containing protein n=1 Tax=Myxococcus fulvus TaxID=33 RepID=A0A511T928_MYXFU|nr:hypothetical protein [Myxococcus fulvus]AKF84102.1 hypothetical protein MFUL124B02_40265 [Myxococcus fulvus 124B02]GEN10681.1 hypothetical protein MFU01_57180 [Myxococcus fulvus]SEU37886.1 hypothetical protein SAMN05443572_112269 [Myxococcus fulvus]
MKKLIATFAVCLGTAAFAQSAPAQPAPSQTQIPSPSTRVDTGVNATDVGRGINGATREASNAQAQENLFNKKHSLSLKGTLKKADDDSVNLTRKDLPDAELDVKAQTVVMLDGKKARVEEIPEGSEVRASFQLDGDNAVAVELRATSPKGTGGSGAVDTMKKDAKKAGDKVEEAGEDVKQDVDDAVH